MRGVNKYPLLSVVIALSLLFGGLAMGRMAASAAMASVSAGDSQGTIDQSAMARCSVMKAGSGCRHQNAGDCDSCIQITQIAQDRNGLNREVPVGFLSVPQEAPPPDRWLLVEPAPPKFTSTV